MVLLSKFSCLVKQKSRIFRSVLIRHYAGAFIVQSFGIFFLKVYSLLLIPTLKNISHGNLSLNSGSNLFGWTQSQIKLSFDNNLLVVRNFLTKPYFISSTYFFFILSCWNCIYIYSILELQSFHSIQRFVLQTIYWLLKSSGNIMKEYQTDELLIHIRNLHLKTKMMIITTLLKTLLNPFNMKCLWNQVQIQLVIHNKIICKTRYLLFLRYLKTKSICRISTTILWNFSNQNKLKKIMNVYEYNINKKIEAEKQKIRKQELERNQLIHQLDQHGTKIQHDDVHLEKTQKRYHYNKLTDLNFHFLHHSPLMLLHKDKNEHLLRMLLT